MAETKKKWVKPELTVLLRRKPGEAVLVACKGGYYHGGPSYYVFTCDDGTRNCGSCAGRTAS